MWIASQHGFYSIVKKGPDEYHVRARLKRDLENLRKRAASHEAFTLPKIQRWPTADYRYRIIINKDELLGVMSTLAEALDYSNFKGRISELEDQRGKLPAYHGLWCAGMDWQRKE